VSIKGQKVGFIGGGNMGEALIKGLLAASLVPADAVHASDVRIERLRTLAQQYGVQLREDNAALVRDVDIVILAVKPQIMASVARQIAPSVTRKKLLISIAAGVSTATIRAALGKDARSSRASPPSPRPRVWSPATSTPRARSSARWAAWSPSTRS
jgi:pyrroline-5-carboxylate reductase